MPEVIPHTVVITDTSCFIILDKINALQILPKIFDVILTTPQIAAEYGKLLPSWVQIQSVNNEALQQKFNQVIDAGEASAIALAQEIKCDYLLTDDLAARKFAEELGLQVKGSAGVLLYAKQKGVIKTIKPFIEKMQQTNFRISTVLIDRILKAADE